MLYLEPRSVVVPCGAGVVQVPKKKKQSLLRGDSVELINTGISCNALWHTSLTAALAARAETLWKTAASCALSFIPKSECIL